MIKHVHFIIDFKEYRPLKTMYRLLIVHTVNMFIPDS